jgi:hypothetical protein
MVLDRVTVCEFARREEFPESALDHLLSIAEQTHRTLGEVLRDVAIASGPLGYRHSLENLVDAALQGYILVPIQLADRRVAIAAAGNPDAALMTIREAVEDAEDQVAAIRYVAECLLGGCHGIAVDDLLNGYHKALPWASSLRRMYAQMLASPFEGATACRSE